MENMKEQTLEDKIFESVPEDQIREFCKMAEEFRKLLEEDLE